MRLKGMRGREAAEQPLVRLTKSSLHGYSACGAVAPETAGRGLILAA
jgi:hypothetical protein